MIKKSLLGFLLQSLGSVLAFLVQFYLAKEFGANEFGKFNYYYGIIGFTSIFLIYGFQYSVSKYKNDVNIQTETLNSFSLLGLVVLPIVFIYFYLNNFSVTIIALLLIGTFSFSLLEIFRILYTTSFKSNKAIFLKTWLFNILFLLIALILNSKFNFKDNLLLALVISYSVISIPIFFKKINFIYLSFDFIKKSFPFFLIQLFYTSHIYLSKIIPSYFYGYKLIAGISIAILVSRVIALIGSTSSFILMPYFSDLFRENKVNKVIDSYKEIRSINTSFTLPLFAFILIYSKKILSYISEDYVEYNLILIIISIGTIFPIIYGPNGTVILMTKSFKKEINSGLILISTFLIISLFGSLNFLVIPVAFALAEILASSYKVFVVKKILNFSFNFKYYFKILFLITLNLFLSYLVFEIQSTPLFYFLTALVLITSILLNMVVLIDKKNKEKYQNKINDFCNSFKL
jgi:O-antigen/teichoic acid export membrane protein